MKTTIQALLASIIILGFGAGDLQTAEPDDDPAGDGMDIIVVFKTHFDIGYTALASEVIDRYRTSMIDDALKVVDQYRDLPVEQQFVWTIPGWPATKITEDWPGQTTMRQKRIRQAFLDGRFVVHALPFTTHTELLEPADLVHGMEYSTRLTEQLGLDRPRDAKMTDVPSHSWILPTLLRHAGIDFLHLGCNPASRSPRVPLLFFWEGPDGSRLLTMYSAAEYGTGLLPPEDWAYPAWLALIQTGDNHGPPRPEEVSGILADIRNRMPGARVRVGRLSDFADAIIAGGTNGIPVVRGDMPDTWIHGPMCDPAGARLARNLRPMITATESLYAHLSLWGADMQNPREALDDAREMSLLYGEHTWGGALSWITQYSANTPYWYGDAFKERRKAGRFERIEASWAEHTAYIENAERILRPVLEMGLDSLAHAAGVPGERIVVFNALPWQRTGIVSVEKGARAGIALRCVDNGEVIPAWNENGRLRFVAESVPPSGYRTYQVISSEVAESEPEHWHEPKIESAFFSAVLDPATGSIRSLFDKRLNRELVDSSSKFGFGRYLYERFDADQAAQFVKDYVKIDAFWGLTELGKPNMPPASEVPYQAAGPEDCAFSIEHYARSVCAVMQSSPGPKLPNAVTTKLTLYDDLPYADLEITLHDKPADPWPEAGWISLPFQVESPRYRLGRLGGITDPEKDFVAGTNNHLWGVHTGVALIGSSGEGVGLCPVDSPLVSLGHPGCWRYSPEFSPREPVVFVNLFNNQWTTNFRLWNEGTWTSRVRIWSFADYDSESELITPSLEARTPLLAAMADGEAGPLDAAASGLALSRKGVALVGFAAESEQTRLTLWELAGRADRELEIALPGMNPIQARPVDLRGEAIEAPADRLKLNTNGKVTAELDAYAPLGLELIAE